MIQNYIKIAGRNILKHKVFSLINIAGLSIGIAACTIIFLYVQHELSYDLYNTKADRIVRITSNLKSPADDLKIATAPAALTTSLQRELPEIESTVRLLESPLIIKDKGSLKREQHVYKTDPQIFSIFDFDFVEGSAASALKELNSIVISQSLARKYFGNQPAIGKVIETDKEPLIVTGVFADRPQNSDMTITGLQNGNLGKDLKWIDDLNFFSFVLFRSSPDLTLLQRKLAAFSNGPAQKELDSYGATAYKLLFTAELLKDVHFNRENLGDNAKGEKQYTVIFSLLAIFILLIALLNYLNLTTARSFERAREIGIRKVVGAGASQIVKQFLFESFLLILIAWLLGNILVKIGLPFVNQLLDTKLTVHWGYTIMFTAAVLLLSIVFAGFYPAFVMSTYKPIVVLKGRLHKSLKGVWMRKAVIVIQFAITAGLIFGTTVIYKQMNFLQNKNIGYNKDQMLAIRFPGDTTLRSAFISFRNELKSRPEILGVTMGNSLDVEGLGASSTTAESDGIKKEFMCNFFRVDANYIPVLQIPVVEGRNFSDEFATDKTEAIIVNQAFVRKMGWKSAIDKKVEGYGENGKVIGVVADFSYKSLHNVIEPLVLVNREAFYTAVNLRMKPEHLSMVEKTFRKHFPGLYFDYEFFDDMLFKYYQQDRVTMSLFNQFTLLAIFVSCLGLYGLVSLVTAHRTKEIGVRKVLGATLAQLFSLLTRDFLLLILVSLAIALPLTAIAMNYWLSAYAFHININWMMFALPVFATILIALLVISREIFKAAIANPVQSLKSE